MARENNSQIILAYCPLSELFGYATDLRSLSQGRASYTMQFDSFSQIPEKKQQEIIDKIMGRIYF
jgi:elongation factor G